MAKAPTSRFAFIIVTRNIVRHMSLRASESASATFCVIVMCSDNVIEMPPRVRRRPFVVRPEHQRRSVKRVLELIMLSQGDYQYILQSSSHWLLW